MHSIIERGKALYWGTSEWTAAEILTAIQVAETHHLHKPIVEQPIYNLFDRHRFAADYDAVYEDYGYGSTTWSPLASGLLTGKYNDGIPEDSRLAHPDYTWLQQFATEERLAKVRLLSKLADELDVPLAQLALAWLLRLPEVSSVITGASRVSQVHQNLEALDVLDKLTPDVLAKIEEIMDNDPNKEEV